MKQRQNQSKTLRTAPRSVTIRLLVFLCLVSAHDLFAGTYKEAIIEIGSIAYPVELRVAQLLKQRLEEQGLTSVLLERESGEVGGRPAQGLKILLGIPAHHNGISKLMHTRNISPLGDLAPGPEGFLLQSYGPGMGDLVMLAGVDDRGCLYAVGELLRQVRVGAGTIQIPDDLHIRTAPAFEIRGTQFGQSGVAKRLAKVRDWTEEETQRVILDYALAGANIFSVTPGPMFDFIKSYGLMTQGGFGANTAGADVPKEWEASESIGRKGYVCLSVLAARQFMLKKCEQYFQSSPTYDLIKFHGGDGGGCECDRCEPYGLTFVQLVEKMATIIHRYHPHTRIYFTNQKFYNEDDKSIFSYLQDKPRDWLWAWGYGPGSDATTWQPGHRQNHRMDLFRYPGFGPYGLYPKEILHQLPPGHALVYYNEITHWKYAQHAYIQMYPRSDRNGDQPPWWSHEIYERQPDQFLTMVYNRLTFYAWPRYYHRVFNDLLPYGIGDITHSSGHHDHFNQWMWQRLLWAPRMTVQAVVDEYCMTWFGEEAAPFMARAIFQLEQNLEENPEKPLSEKEGIDTYYSLVKQAGKRMPEAQLKSSWLWRMYMQKAALDKYIALSVQQQVQLQQRIEENIRTSIQAQTSDKAIRESLQWLDDLEESPIMVQLREEAGQLGEESNELFGVRSEGYYNLKHDFIGLGWLRRQLERALESSGAVKSEMLNMIVNYANPGEGGYYDNLGTYNPAPHVIAGYPYDHGQPYVSQMLSEGNRRSQRTMHFTQDEAQGVMLRYTGLDPNASYRVRFTLVRPWYQERYAMRMNQKSESIYADDLLIADDIELPQQMSDFFTFDIPGEVTKDGELVIRFEKAADVAAGDRVSTEQWRNSGGWGTIVSEVWLMKK